jgi:hypothetical protein
MATISTGVLSANEPNKNRTGVGASTGGSLPASGRGMGATAGASDTVGAKEAQVTRGEAHPEQSNVQRAALLEKAEEAAAKLAELMDKLAGTGASAACSESSREGRLKAAAVLLQMAGPLGQPAPDQGSRAPAAIVGALRAKETEKEARWQCKVPTCAETCHPLIACPQFLLMPPEEKWDLVTLSGFCKGCLTPGHGTKVRDCPFRNELDGLCARHRCRQAHHWLLHVEGRPNPRPHHRSEQCTTVSKQHSTQVVATLAHLVHPAPVQLVTQRIKTTTGRSCITFWDTGSQVTLMTHEAAKEMGLKPIPGPPLNMTGVGNSQKTRSTVRYKILLVDTGGRTVEVAAYGISHIMDPLETIEPEMIKAVFPEVPTGGMEAASGSVDLLMGHDNLRLFPVEHRRVEDAALHRSRFGTGWIASGRPPNPEGPKSAVGGITSAGVRNNAETALSADGVANEKEAASTQEPVSVATRGRPRREGRPNGSREQLGPERTTGATRAGSLKSPSRVVPPLHIENGIFQPSDFLSAEALGTDMPRRCKNCLKCKECQF